MSDLVKLTMETEVNAASLGIALGLTARRVQQMAKEGTIDSSGRGRYNLSTAISQYIDFRSRDFDEFEFKQAAARSEAKLKEAKAQIAKMTADELRGQLHRADDVEAMLNDIVYSIQGMLTALPGRVAIDCANAGDPAKVADILRRECNDMLAELSQYEYDPDKAAERVRERMKWKTKPLENDSETNDSTDE